MRCQVCNAEWDDDAVFCEKCGARLSKDNSIASKLHLSKKGPAAAGAAQGVSGGFYSSTNKGKSTDANNSVVFDAKTTEEDVAHIVIDKSEITAKPEASSEAEADLSSVSSQSTVSPAPSVADEPVAETFDISSDSDVQDISEGMVDLSSGEAELDLSAEGELDLSADAESLDLTIEPEPQKPAVQPASVQPKPAAAAATAAAAGGIAAMIQKAMDNAGGSSEETETQIQEPETVSEAVSEPAPEASEPAAASADAVSESAPQAQTAADAGSGQEASEASGDEEEVDESEISGTFEYNAGLADKKLTVFAGCAFGSFACLLLAAVTDDLLRYLLAVLSAGCFGYAFYKTGETVRAVRNALIKGEGYFFVEYVNEIKKLMKAGIIPVVAGLVIALISVLPWFVTYDKYMLWMAFFVMTMGICIGGVCAARLLVVRNAFGILAQGQKTKQNYAEIINYSLCGAFVVAIVFYAVCLV